MLCSEHMCHRYRLADYWESPYWPAKVLLNTTPPVVETRNMSLWEMGNRVVLCEWRVVRHFLETHTGCLIKGAACMARVDCLCVDQAPFR